MALYIYQAFSRDGKKISGSLDAGSSKQVKEVLLRQGIYPVSILLSSDASAKRFSWASLLETSVSEKDKIFFTEQLTVLLRAGVPLADALSLLVEQTSGKMRRITVFLRDGLREGKSFASGLSEFPDVFEVLYIQLVKAGEISGNLDVVLDRLALYLKRRAEIKKKVQGALMYPLIQLVVVLGVVAALLVFVIPQVAPVLADQGTKLPWATRFLMGISDFVRGHYLLILIVPAVVIGVFYLWKRTESGARILDTVFLKLPFVGHFLRTNTVVSFSRTLGMLMTSGVTLADSLDIVCNIVDNRVLADTLRGAREQIIKQGRVTEYLKQTNLFPTLAIYLLDTGEQSGSLDKMLLQVAAQYERELETLSDRLIAIINPLFIILVAVLVGFSVYAIMGPIMGLATSAGRM
ncbi:TPA: hypothetical protein DCW54_01520 [Candidatus Dependentiae bacterium]|nr:hypothetical protein [Candidatus Dependentiae bacterium]